MLNAESLVKKIEKEDLIIVVSRRSGEGGKWNEIKEIEFKINNNDSQKIYQWNNEALFGFEESPETNCVPPISANPKLTHQVIKAFLSVLKKKNLLNTTQSIYLLIHAEELGVDGDRRLEGKKVLIFDNNSKLILKERRFHRRLAVLNQDNTVVEDMNIRDWGQYLRQISQDTGIQNKHWELWTFIHEKDCDDICRCFSKEEVYNCLLEVLKKGKRLSETLPLFKHRIAHLFLPLDIDLQGISEVDQKTKVKYLTEVLKNNCAGYYCQKLKALQYTISKKLVVDSNKIPKDLKDTESLSDLISADKQKEKAWRTLLQLAGAGNKSIIESFMTLLDKKAKVIFKNELIKEDSINEILSFFKNSTIESVTQLKVKSFHDWFCALNNCLENL